MEDNIIINKSETISRCVLRVHEDYLASKGNFLKDYTRQDAIILNLQRAIQAATDLASHVVRKKNLSVPKEYKDLFLTLHEANIISKAVQDKMINMVGFRNVAVHEYTKLDMNIVVSVIEKHLGDFEQFIQAILKA